MHSFPNRRSSALERCQSAYDRGRVAGHHPRRRSSHRAVERDFRNEGMSCDGMLFATMNDELEAACAIDLCILRGDTLGCAIDDDVGLSKKIVQSAGNGDASLAHRFGVPNRERTKIDTFSFEHPTAPIRCHKPEERRV